MIDARRIANDIRDEDREEIAATSNTGDPFAAIMGSVRRSIRAYVVHADGVPVCIGGFIPGDQPGTVQGWMLSAKSIESCWRDFCRGAKDTLADIVKDFSLVYGFVDVRYIKAIRFLLWAGFRDGPVYAMAPKSMPFLKMSLSVGA